MTAWNPGITPVPGSSFGFGSSVVAAPDEVADTYLFTSEITKIGAWGKKFNLIKFTSITNRRTRKFKGTYDNGSLPLAFGYDVGDPGQAAMLAAQNSDLNFNIRILLNDSQGISLDITTNATTAAASKVLHFASTTGVALGMGVADVTAPTVIPAGAIVESFDASTVTLNKAVTGAGVGGTDDIKFTSNPTAFYFGAKVMSFECAAESDATVVTGAAQLEIDTEILQIPAS